MKAIPIVGIVIPCYNEEAVLGETTRCLISLLSKMINDGLVANDSSVFYIDDGSRDRTWSMIEEYAQSSRLISGLKLSRNRGHQNALLCGLMESPGDILISLDADLQDDLAIIPEMIERYRQGSEIVYAVRSKRETDTFFKRFTAEGYYKLMAFMGVEVVFNHADYRLMSRRSIEALRQYEETHLFLRGLIPLLGFSTAIVTFDRAERFAGESKYPLRKMLAFAWQGITSFSPYPLRLITGMGVLVSLGALAMAAWALLLRLFTDAALPGWASTVIPMYFLGGVQLLSLGVIGEYLAKVFEATKRRPRFHLETTCGAGFQLSVSQSQASRPQLVQAAR